MRRPLRFVDRTGRVVDLTIDPAPGATVGDLADHLAQLCGAPRGGTVASRWPRDRRGSPPDRAMSLAEFGPRAGSTVTLVPQRARPGTDTGSGTPAARTVDAGVHSHHLAPVRLISSGSRPTADGRSLRYGSNQVHDAVVDVGTHVSVRATGGADIRVGGAALLGAARVVDGDLLTVGGKPWTVRVEGPLHPPPTDGWTQEVPRRARATAEYLPTTLELPTPPPSTRIPGFPVLSAMVPLLMGVVLWYATGSWLAAGFMLFSVVFVVASGLEARREARREDRARVAEFRADLDDAVTRIETARAHQRDRHRAMGLDPAELRSLLDRHDLSVGGRLWERCSDSGRPAGTRVRVGTAERPLQDQIASVGSGRRELRRELDSVRQRLSRVDDIVTLDLEQTGGLVIEGVDERAADVARSMVLQLATLVSPDELSVRLLLDGPRAAGWNDLRWLPHHETPRRRVEIVVADGADLQALRSMLQHTGQEGLLVLWVTPPGGVRPAGIGAVLELDGAMGTLRIDHVDDSTEVVDRIDVDHLAPDESEPLARSLTGLVPAPELWLERPGVAPHVSTSSLPASVSLADVIADPQLLVDPPALASRWAATGLHHLSTPVGIAEHGGVLNLDLANDGPHALVAGTTGAGKSELLRTFLVSAALHHSPQRLQYLLIDYKGGAAFGALDALPHTVGSITDLSGALATRALTSLRSELRHREVAVALAGDERWEGPALLVVVDEFATLAAELPDFIDGLVDLAQRGRSLGIHLVLATQRPAGVVTDSIRANITMRLALRVADEDDSLDVVDSPAAAHLPRSAPGRVVVRPGPGRVAEVQIAHSAAPHVARPAVTSTRWGGAPQDTAAPTPTDGLADVAAPHRAPPTQLTVAVRTAVDAAALEGAGPPRRPWLDPLPDRIGIGEVAPSTRRGVVVIGVVDRPDLQRRDPLAIDLARDGGLIAIGAGGTGRSTLVCTLAAALARHRQESWIVHVISNSCAGRPVEHLRSLPAVGDVLEVDDRERVTRLLRQTLDEIARRSRSGAHDPPAAPRLVVIDGIAAMEERYERIDRGEAMDLLTRIAREGRSVGVHVALTAQRRAEVPAALAGVLGARVLLRSSTADEAALLGLDDAAASPELPPGRCWVGGHLAQVAHCDDSVGHDPTGAGGDPVPTSRPGIRRSGRANSIPRLPTLVRRDELWSWNAGGPADSATGSEVLGGRAQPEHDHLVPIGLDGDTFDVVHLDLRRHHALVVGPPRSGVTTALQSLVAGHRNAHLLSSPTAAELAAEVDAAIDAATRAGSTVLAIDGLPAMLDGPDAGPAGELLERVLRVGRDHPLRLVAGGEVDAMSGCYHDVVAALRRERTGLLLGGDPELHGTLFHAGLRARSDLPPAPGRGWLLGPGTAVRVQVAAAQPR